MSTGTDADPRDQIVAAAAKVFATEATRQVTLKRVALEARVPFELVSERWASPTDLLEAVFQKLTGEIQSDWADGFAPRHGGDLDADQSERLDALVNIVLRASLDGVALGQVHHRYPIVDRMIEHATARGLDPRTARYRIFELLVVEFGLRAFSPHLLNACGLHDESAEQVRSEISALELSLQTLPPVPTEE
jgi:TetR/AcrR family transcriptional regulator, repressor for neighboring sulfatase